MEGCHNFLASLGFRVEYGHVQYVRTTPHTSFFYAVWAGFLRTIGECIDLVPSWGTMK